MDELEISGRRYLSTRRAAKDHKYTSDYVGQLIRAGKVVGKKVGRSWYVEEQSLNAYLNGERAEVAPVVQKKPVERLVEEPAPAVVAEIKEEVTKTISAPQPTEEIISEQRVGEENSSEKTFEPVILKTKNLEEHHIPIRTITPPQKTSSAGLHYVTDDEPALPEIKRKALATVMPAVLPQESFSEEDTDAEYVEIIPNKRVGVFAITGLVVVGIATLSATALLSATLNARIVVEQGQVANVGYTFQ